MLFERKTKYLTEPSKESCIESGKIFHLICYLLSSFFHVYVVARNRTMGKGIYYGQQNYSVSKFNVFGQKVELVIFLDSQY